MGGTKGGLAAVPDGPHEERVPHSTEAEQSLIGSLLMDNGMFPILSQLVNKDDFYYAQHGEIYSAICDMAGKGLPADLVTVADQLRRAGRLDFAGGVTTLAYCMNVVPTATFAEHYARVVRENSLLRQAYFLARKVQAAVGTGDPSVKDPGRFLRGTAEKFTDLAVGLTGGAAVVRMGDSIGQDATEIVTRREGLRGVTTGFQGLDDLTAGLQDGQLIILGARPSMGKSTLALNMAVSAAKNGAKVLFHSLEMKRRALTEKVIVAMGQANAENVRVGRFSDEDLIGLALGTARAEGLALFICDQFEMTPLGIRAKAQWLRARHGLDMVVVDYLQLMLADSPNGNRNLEMSDISRQLKLLAGALDVPVMALSQLSREVEKRADKRPVMADLRDSGSIEQDADVVMFLYRPDYYELAAHGSQDNTGEVVETELIVAKQREGGLGTVPMGFNKKHVRFEDLAE